MAQVRYIVDNVDDAIAFYVSKRNSVRPWQSWCMAT